MENFWDNIWGGFRRDDPDTSVEAAVSVHTQPLEQIVLGVIRRFPRGVTADEVQMMLPEIPMNTITPRFASLIRKDLIKDSGERKKGNSGRLQRVLVVK